MTYEEWFTDLNITRESGWNEDNWQAHLHPRRGAYQVAECLMALAERDYFAFNNDPSAPTSEFEWMKDFIYDTERVQRSAYDIVVGMKSRISRMLDEQNAPYQSSKWANQIVAGGGGIYPAVDKLAP